LSNFSFFFKIAALQLVEQGKIQLDSPVHPILPELANPVVLDSSGGDEPGFKPAQREITLRQLLNHSSGLLYHPPRKGEPPDGLPFPLIARYDKSDPVSHFCNFLKVGTTCSPSMYYLDIHGFDSL
jgi:CubicO group peptidase (beta-lactamase class C family)